MIKLISYLEIVLIFFLFKKNINFLLQVLKKLLYLMSLQETLSLMKSLIIQFQSKKIKMNKFEIWMFL